MQKSQKTKKPAIHRLYDRYAYLAEIYAKKLWKTSSIGMGYDDVVQELRMKIYTSIGAYVKRWANFKKTGNYKPVPMKFYIQAAMNNKLIDMVDQIKKDINLNSLSIEDHNFDYGVSSNGLSTLKLNGRNKEAVICGIDLLQGLDLRQKDAFCMYMKGHPIKTIEKLYKGKVNQMLCPCTVTEYGDAKPGCKSCGGTRYIKDIGTMIRSQVEVIREYKEELYSGEQKMQYSYQLSEED